MLPKVRTILYCLILLLPGRLPAQPSTAPDQGQLLPAPEAAPTKAQETLAFQRPEATTPLRQDAPTLQRPEAATPQQAPRRVLSGRADRSIRFDSAAKQFTESLPLGNGRLGAMLFGGTATERIALNEISLWSGGYQDADNDSAYHYLKPIQEHLLAGRNRQAQELLQQHFVSKGVGSGYGSGAREKYGSYQTLGDLFLHWKDSTSPVSGYERVLDLDQAVATLRYQRKGVTITEQVFTDHINDITWVRLHSSRKGGLHLVLSLHRQEHARITAGGGRITMQGQLPSGGEAGMRYAVVAEPVLRDGRLRQEGNRLVLEGATECWIKVAAATNYDPVSYRLGDRDPLRVAEGQLSRTKTITWQRAQSGSARVHQQLFRANTWTMPGNPEVEGLTTNQRLVRYARGGSDPLLPVLYYNFGRYLLISSSRPGQLPANLQGLWAVEYQAPWNGDYHLNINIQMNYWLAETTNLGGLAETLHRFTAAVEENGRRTTKAD